MRLSDLKDIYIPDYLVEQSFYKSNPVLKNTGYNLKKEPVSLKQWIQSKIDSGELGLLKNINVNYSVSDIDINLGLKKITLSQATELKAGLLSAIDKRKINTLSNPTADNVSVNPVGNISSTNVQDALEELQNDIDLIGSGGGGSSSMYIYTFGDVLTYTIPAATHGLSKITAVLVTNTFDEEISISFSIDSFQNITFNSNISLLNHTVILKEHPVYYETILGNVTTATILYTTHGIFRIGSVIILDPFGAIVSVPFSILVNDITLNSNISLLNHKLIIS